MSNAEDRKQQVAETVSLLRNARAGLEFDIAAAVANLVGSFSEAYGVVVTGVTVDLADVSAMGGSPGTAVTGARVELKVV